MWFVFPQIAGLGRSSAAQLYGIVDLKEAQDYLAHEVLGTRLIKISEAVLAHKGTAPEAILGSVDALKLRSSMTLFQVAGGGLVFGDVLAAFYAGENCPKTLEMLRDVPE